MKKRSSAHTLSFCVVVAAAILTNSYGAIVSEWNADGYTDGTTWSGTADATVREGSPTAGLDATSVPGFNLDYINFSDAVDTAFEVDVAGNGVAGLSEFSASVVFRTTSAGASGEDDFWRNEGLVGIELPGGGQGDWGIGIAAGGLINGGSALTAADAGSLGPVVNEGNWHVVTMVIDDLGDTTHDRRLYLDGAEVASDLALVNGGASSVVAASALFFGDHQPGDANVTKENYQGDIAHIRLDDVALTPAEVTAAHADYLGTLVSTTDTDNDGLPDDWEERWFGDDNLSQGPDDNPDNDGLTNLEELQENPDLNPDDDDTDDDGLNDGAEVTGPTDPLNPDSDGDNLTDGDEVAGANGFVTDPTNPDSDNDGVTDDTDPDPNDPNIPATPAGSGALCLDGFSFLTFTNDNPEARIPTGDEVFTLEAWINPTTIPDGGQNGGQISFWGTQGPASTSNGFRLRGSGGVRHYFWGNDHDEDFGIDVLPDTTGVADPNNGGDPSGWHHLALTYDGAQTVWYWNGDPLGNPRAVSAVSVADQNFRIGSRIGAEFFDGWIDELRIWNVARSPEDIQETLNTSLAGNESGLVAYWDFSDGFTDASGNGHDAESGGGTPKVDRFRNAPVSGGPAGLEITDIVFDEGTRTATITWRSRAGRVYAVDFSDDMQAGVEDAWREIDDGVVATSESSNFSEPVPAGVLRRFYRVRDVTP